MQIGKLNIKVQFQSTPMAYAGEAPVIEVIPPTRWDKFKDRAQERIRWLMDIDDGAGAVVCMISVLMIFGFLTVRLIQLDSTMDTKAMSCKALDKTTLSIECHFH